MYSDALLLLLNVRQKCRFQNQWDVDYSPQNVCVCVCIYKCVTWHPALTLFQKHTGPWSYWRTTTRNWPNRKTNSCGLPSSALSVSSSLDCSKHYSVSTRATWVWHSLSQGEDVLIALFCVLVSVYIQSDKSERMRWHNRKEICEFTITSTVLWDFAQYRPIPK